MEAAPLGKNFQLYFPGNCSALNKRAAPLPKHEDHEDQHRARDPLKSHCEGVAEEGLCSARGLVGKDPFEKCLLASAGWVASGKNQKRSKSHILQKDVL